MRTRFLLPAIGIALVVGLLADPVLAQNLADQINAQIGAGAQAAEIGEAVPPQQIIAGMIKVLLSLVGTFFLALTVYSGFILFTARGRDEKVEKGQKTLRAAVIGLLIVMMAYGITIFASRLITSSVSGDPAQVQEGSGIRANCRGLDCNVGAF